MRVWAEALPPCAPGLGPWKRGPGPKLPGLCQPRILGPAVGNVQDALFVGKALDVTGVGDLADQHQSHRDDEELSPAHIATR